MYKNKTRWKRVGEDDDIEIEDNAIDVHQVQSYVENINKTTLHDLLKKVYICLNNYVTVI